MIVRINGIGTLVSVQQIIGKDLFATTNVNVRKYADPTLSKDSILYTSKPGERLGRVYSWVTRPGSKSGQDVWYMLEAEGKTPVRWVNHHPTNLSLKKLIEQGAKTIEQQRKEEEEQKKEDERGPLDWIKDLWNNSGGVLKYAVPVLIVLAGYKIVNNLTSKKQK